MALMGIMTAILDTLQCQHFSPILCKAWKLLGPGASAVHPFFWYWVVFWVTGTWGCNLKVNPSNLHIALDCWPQPSCCPIYQYINTAFSSIRPSLCRRHMLCLHWNLLIPPHLESWVLFMGTQPPINVALQCIWKGMGWE